MKPRGLRRDEESSLKNDLKEASEGRKPRRRTKPVSEIRFNMALRDCTS